MAAEVTLVHECNFTKSDGKNASGDLPPLLQDASGGLSSPSLREVSTCELGTDAAEPPEIPGTPSLEKQTAQHSTASGQKHPMVKSSGTRMILELNATRTVDERKLETYFNLAMAAVIVTNVFMIAAETDFGPDADSGPEDRIFWIILDSIYVLVFIGEIFVRVYWEREKWITNAWNYLDVIIVICAMIDVWIMSFVTKGGALGLLTLLRIFRLVRLIRLLKLMRAFSGMYVIVMAFMSAINSMVFVGSMMLFGILMYAILGVTIIGRNKNLDDVRIEDDTVYDRFGTVYRATYSLFELMTLEGWDRTARPIVEKQPFLVVYILSFIMIFTFGMLNMVVALVVEKTMEQTRLLTEMKQAEIKENLRQELMYIKAMIFEGDDDGTGTLSRNEFEKIVLHNDQVKLILKKMGVAIDDAQELYSVLDWDHSGELTIQEFIDGVSKVKNDVPSTWDVLSTRTSVHSISSNIGQPLEERCLTDRIDSIEARLDSQSEILQELLAHARNLRGVTCLVSPSVNSLS